ncbi:MAG: hypothetical protein IJT65_02025 [Eubacterium sp.]|nr:hypothetical protein [Eubacterium sp.]
MEQTIPVTNKNATPATKVYPKSIIAALALLGELVIIIFKPGGQYDEALAVASTVLVITFIATGKTTKYDQNTILLLAIIASIGILGNLVYDINKSYFSVMVDILTQIKPFVIFFALRYFLTTKERKTVIDYLTPIAKLFMIAAFIFCVLNQFKSSTAPGGFRYGIRIFQFFYIFNHYYIASALFFFGIIVCNNRINEKLKRFYIIIGCIAIIGALKSLAIISVGTFVFLMLYYKKYERITFKVIIPLLLLIVLLSRFQINAYILNTTSPRRIFIDYAIKNANEHFPLGSGFGTFGSAEAAKHYSALYIKYHFERFWGMSQGDKKFLHDNYWQTILGQFGWIGFPFFVYFYYRLFKTSYDPNSKSYERAICNGIFLGMMVFALGSASITSDPGVICFAALALFSEPEEKFGKNNKRIRIKF